MSIVSPDGQPVGTNQVQVTPDQVSVVGYHLLDATAGKLLQLGVPPDRIVDHLAHLIVNLVSRVDSGEERGKILNTLFDGMRKNVAQKAGQRLLQATSRFPRQ